MQCFETAAPLWCFCVSRLCCLNTFIIYRLGSGLTKVVCLFLMPIDSRHRESTEISETRITSHENTFQRSTRQRQGICEI